MFKGRDTVLLVVGILVEIVQGVSQSDNEVAVLSLILLKLALPMWVAVT
jgi:hypothetical protein